ncbi:MAG: lysozyme [Velocimicrobium sp.]
MGKKIAKAGFELIKSFEGCRLTAYKCPAGVWTIGYGHTGRVRGLKIKEGLKISHKKADALLKRDLRVFQKSVNKAKIGFRPNQNQFDALVSFTFNVGPGNLNRLLSNGSRDAKTVADKMVLYNKANGKELTGLTRRRKEEQKLFNNASRVNNRGKVDTL